jgi:outer membrane receptor protein involved in Fe transport
VDWVLVGDREETLRGFREKSPGYTRLDALISFDLNRWFEVYVRGENLNNDHYDEALGFDNPSTRFFVGTKAKF